MRSATLYKILAALLVLIAAVLAANHFADLTALHLAPTTQALVGLTAGAGIGVTAALMGVAGGELLIPTIVLLYGLDIKTAGSLSLAISLPTVLVAFARYSRDDSFRVLRDHGRFVVAMAAGSVVGVFLGGLLLGMVPELVLVPHPPRSFCSPRSRSGDTASHPPWSEDRTRPAPPPSRWRSAAR